MLNNIELEHMTFLALQGATDSLIESQTILHLMVRKGLVSLEEINDARDDIRNEPKYQAILQALNSNAEKMNELLKFEKELQSSLRPEEWEQLTEGEKSFLVEKVKEMTKR